MNKTSEQLGELFAALAKAQSQITSAVKDAKNPFFKSEYSTLDSCWDCCRLPLSSNGLSVVQTVEDVEGKLYLCSFLGHSSGQYISSKMPLLLAKNDAQSLGSALSYMRRYSLCALVGVSSGDDDDGEKAMSGTRISPKSPPSMPTYPEEVKNEEMTLESFCIRLAWSTGEENHFPKIQEYLEHLEKTKAVSVVKIMEQALNPALTKKFYKSYQDWRTTNY